MKVAALIPAYNPASALTDLVRQLSASRFDAIIVVNDGSSIDCDEIFNEIKNFEKVYLLQHAVNLGKGAALKTGLNYIFCSYRDYGGVVTIDADGQHLVKDAEKVAEELEDYPDSLIMGSRKFQEGIPFRSMLGNALTKSLFRALVGQKLTDTQTGLRGIPMVLIPKLLKISSSGYEFELDMLLACKHGGTPIREREINTVYIDGNKSSHFNPILDSMKIYYVLFRFSFASFATAIIDYTIFFLSYNFDHNIAESQVLARLFALFFNYLAVRRMVFYSDQKHVKTFPRYLLLVVVSGFISYNLIKFLTAFSPLTVMPAKVLAELIIFLGNFAVQRDFIFKKTKERVQTDWDKYYSKPYKTATYSRRITANTLLNMMNKYIPAAKSALKIGEWGGANSCFFDGIMENIKPAQYHVFDNNRLGLDKFHERTGNMKPVFIHNHDVLNFDEQFHLDLVFSVGLIEHFSVKDTELAIKAHFKALKPDGIAILSFPTPTMLYRLSRFVAEFLGLWIFHDERPLDEQEVARTVGTYGEILTKKIIWPIFFTQMMIVAKKFPEERKEILL